MEGVYPQKLVGHPLEVQQILGLRISRVNKINQEIIQFIDKKSNGIGANNITDLTQYSNQ